MRFWAILFASTFVFGCGSLHKETVLQHSRIPSAEYPVYMSTEEVRQARLKQFLESSKSFTEQDKINYLFGIIRSSDAVFIRNGDQFAGDVASRWLRWKMRHRQYRDNPIITARDFVDRVCLRSERTGLAYEVIISGGKRERLQKVLTHELQALDNALREHALLHALTGEKAGLKKTKESLPAPILLPAVA